VRDRARSETAKGCRVTPRTDDNRQESSVDPHSHAIESGRMLSLRRAMVSPLSDDIPYSTMSFDSCAILRGGFLASESGRPSPARHQEEAS
jgi:hypothetical protein